MTFAIQFGPCCYCGEAIVEAGPDPCTVQVTTAQGKWQVWKAHGGCFKSRLAAPPEAPSLFEPAHF